MNYRKRSFRSFSLFDRRKNAHQVSEELGIPYKEASHLYNLYLEHRAVPEAELRLDSEITRYYAETLLSEMEERRTAADVAIRRTIRCARKVSGYAVSPCIEVWIFDTAIGRSYTWGVDDAMAIPYMVTAKLLKALQHPKGILCN